MQPTIATISDFIKNTFFPNICLVCGELVQNSNFNCCASCINQSERIALGLAKSWDLPCLFGAIKRTQMTHSQTSLDINERQLNVQDAFFNNASAAGFRIAIIDDVLTTGVTIAACAKCLKSNGAKSVIAINCGTPKLGIKN